MLYIARQPILDRALRTYGFELLHRSSTVNAAVIDDPDHATATLAQQAVVEWGLDELVGRSWAFVNVPASYLISGAYQTLPANRVILEILEGCVVDGQFASALREARRHGYRVAFDDFADDDDRSVVLDLADMVKIEVDQWPLDRVAARAGEIRRDAPSVALLAEKVETYEQFIRCRAMGFDYFQGYFFARPSVLRRNSLPIGFQGAMTLLNNLMDPAAGIDELERTILSDPTLAYRVLRVASSASSGLTSIPSVRYALVMLGLRAVRQIASLMVLAAETPANEAVIALGLDRAKTAATYAERVLPERAEPAFLVGLMSVLDGLFGLPLVEICDAVSIDGDVRAALVGQTGPLGAVLQMAMAFERDDPVSHMPEGIDIHVAIEAYAVAARWSRSLGPLVAAPVGA